MVDVSQYNQTYTLTSFEKMRVASVLKKVLLMLSEVFESIEKLQAQNKRKFVFLGERGEQEDMFYPEVGDICRDKFDFQVS